MFGCLNTVRSSVLSTFKRCKLRQGSDDAWRCVLSSANGCKNVHRSTYHSKESSVQMKPTNNILNSENYELICPITEAYFSQVITHMRNNFFDDEPTSSSLKSGPRGTPMPYFEKLYLEALEEFLSVMYIHVPSNQVAAISINGIFHPDGISEEIDPFSEDIEAKVLHEVFTNIHKCLDLFKKYDVDRIFDIKAVSVDTNHRQRGLAGAIISKCIEIAGACGCQIVKTEGTSAFSQKAFTKLGFETIWERNYSDFLCENGEPYFHIPDDHHKTLKIMTKTLTVPE